MTSPYFQGQAEIERLKTPLSIEQYGGILPLGDTTPSVRDLRTCILKNVGAVTVTRFDNGQAGQVISVLGDGNTTIQHYAGAINAANGLKIKTNTGADKLLAVDIAYSFTCYEDQATGVAYWVEDSGSGGGGGGGGGAPTNAQYLVGSADATLSAERVVTDTSTATWDLSTPGQAKVNVPYGSAGLTFAEGMSISSLGG